MDTSWIDEVVDRVLLNESDGQELTSAQLVQFLEEVRCGPVRMWPTLIEDSVAIQIDVDGCRGCVDLWVEPGVYATLDEVLEEVLEAAIDLLLSSFTHGGEPIAIERS